MGSALSTTLAIPRIPPARTPQPQTAVRMRYALPPWAFRMARMAEAGKLSVD